MSETLADISPEIGGACDAAPSVDPVIEHVKRALLPIAINNGTDQITQASQRVAAVLLPFVKRSSGWHLIYTQRPETMPSHAGQISFPGGKMEAGETVAQTALRETEEEIGLGEDDITLIGRLPSFDAMGSFRITPFAGIVSPDAKIQIDEREVAEAFEVPIRFLMNPENHHERTVQFGGEDHIIYDMPYTGADGVLRNIWGMTAMMTRRVWERGFRGLDD